MTGSHALAQLAMLHAEVDAAVERLVRLHGTALRCGPQCADCCMDGVTVFEVEAALIRREHAELLRAGVPHPAGACAFLDEQGACRIYAQRPYVCRTQGLPLRWLDEGPDGQLVEYRDICALNEEALSVTTLEPEACWTIGPVEESLCSVQLRWSGEHLRRVALRALFTGG